MLTTVNTGTEPQEIYAAIENAMLANPTVSGILSLECCSVSPAGEYVKRNGLTGEVTVVGFDELPQTLQLIEEGVIAASLSQAPERQSYAAVRMLLDALDGRNAFQGEFVRLVVGLARQPFAQLRFEHADYSLPTRAPSAQVVIETAVENAGQAIVIQCFEQ